MKDKKAKGQKVNGVPTKQNPSRGCFFTGENQRTRIDGVTKQNMKRKKKRAWP